MKSWANGLLLLCSGSCCARSGFAVVNGRMQTECLRRRLGWRTRRSQYLDTFLSACLHVAPSVDHRRLAVTEALGVIVAEVNGSDLVLVIQILEELHVFFGHIVVVVGFLAIFAEEQFTLLIVPDLDRCV